MATVRIRRLGTGPELVVEGAEDLVAHFLRHDPSARPGGYDDLAGHGERDRIALAEVVAINSTMRARSPHRVWAGIVDTPDPLPWLAALSPEWDLVTAPDAVWEASIRGPMTEALVAAMAPGRAVAVGTKILHLKRPRLFPVLDSRVLEQLGWTARVPMIRVVEHLRAAGGANLEALRTIQAAIAPAERSLVRILDIILWTSHPAAGLAPTMGNWQHRLVMTAAPALDQPLAPASPPPVPPRPLAPPAGPPTGGPPSFDELWERIERAGPCRVVSSLGTEYQVFARVVKDRKALVAKGVRVSIYVHADCLWRDYTCQGVRAGGLYHGHPSLWDC